MTVHHYITARHVARQRVPQRQRYVARPARQSRPAPRTRLAPQTALPVAPGMTPHVVHQRSAFEQNLRMYAGIATVYTGISGVVPPVLATLVAGSMMGPVVPKELKEMGWALAWTALGATAAGMAVSADLQPVERVLLPLAFHGAFLLAATTHHHGAFASLYREIERMEARDPLQPHIEHVPSGVCTLKQAVAKYPWVREGVEYFGKRCREDALLASFFAFDHEPPTVENVLRRLSYVRFLDRSDRDMGDRLGEMRDGIDGIMMYSQEPAMVAHEIAHSLHADIIRRCITLDQATTLIQRIEEGKTPEELAELRDTSYRAVSQLVHRQHLGQRQRPRFDARMRKHAQLLLWKYSHFSNADNPIEAVASAVNVYEYSPEGRALLLGMHYLLRPMLQVSGRMPFHFAGRFYPYNSTRYQRECLRAGPIGCLLLPE